MTVQETAQAFLDLTAADEAELRAKAAAEMNRAKPLPTTADHIFTLPRRTHDMTQPGPAPAVTWPGPPTGAELPALAGGRSTPVIPNWPSSTADRSRLGAPHRP